MCAMGDGEFETGPVLLAMSEALTERALCLLLPCVVFKEDELRWKLRMSTDRPECIMRGRERKRSSSRRLPNPHSRRRMRLSKYETGKIF